MTHSVSERNVSTGTQGIHPMLAYCDALCHYRGMDRLKGTPETLDQAIRNGLDDAMKSEAPLHAADAVHAAIRDFLAQKFQAAGWACHDPVLEAKILQLFREVTK